MSEHRRTHPSKRWCFLAAVMTITVASSPASAQQNTQNDDLWGAVNSGLYGLVKGAGYGPGHYLQLSAFPVPAAWSTADGGYSLYMVANNVPLWEPTWSFSVRRLDDAYGIFINGIDIKGNLTPKDRKALEAAENQWATARKAYDKEIEAVEAKWLTDSAANPRQNRDDYMRHHTAEAVRLRNIAHRAFLDYNDKIPPDFRTVADLLERYDLEGTDLTRQLVVYPNTPAEAVAQDKQNWPSVRMHAFTGSADLLSTMIKSADQHANDPGWAKPGFSFGTTHTIRDEDRLNWGGSASYSGFFGTISVGGKSESYTLNETKKEFSLTFQALAVDSVAVGPSPAWYSDYLTTHYKCGPFKKDAHGKPSIDPKEFFGENGKLSLIPVSVMVAYKPVIVLHLSQNDFNEVQSHIAGSAGYSIGPFSIGGGADEVKKHTVIDGNNRNITMNFDYPYPMVLAVVSQRLNADFKCPVAVQ